MAEGTRLKQIEPQLQEFREFMTSTKQFMVEVKQQHEETKQSFVDVEKNADRRQEQLVEMMRSLLPIDRAPGDSRQEAVQVGQGAPILQARSVLGAGLECPSTEIRAPKVVSNLDEDPKELQKINDDIVETEAMHHVILFDPLPEGNTQSPELESVVEGSEFSMESLAFLNAHKVFVKMLEKYNAEPIESSKFSWVDPNPSIFLDISSAHKVFVELSGLGVFEMKLTEICHDSESSLVMEMIVDKHRPMDNISVFDPGIDGRQEFVSWDLTIFVLVYIENKTDIDHSNWVFDPGINE